MKALLVVFLWALAGSGIGGAVERITGLGMSIPVLVAFTVVGLCLGLRIMLATRSASVVRVPRAADARRAPDGLSRPA